MEFGLFIICIAALGVVAAQGYDMKSDRTALLSVRASIPDLQDLWNMTNSPCSWSGVSCRSGRVWELTLVELALVGRIPPSVGHLSALRTFDMRRNRLSGCIPADLNLPKLMYFNVSDNQLSGPIPVSLSKWPSSAFLGKYRNSQNMLCGKPLPACTVDQAHCLFVLGQASAQN